MASEGKGGVEIVSCYRQDVLPVRLLYARWPRRKIRLKIMLSYAEYFHLTNFSILKHITNDAYQRFTIQSLYGRSYKCTLSCILQDFVKDKKASI